ncbi:MAG: SBBP repeat-containing protein [Thermoplasmata archaeon]|nr:MAG: SBBP repeat-containing protein [Thermoplasmata archaeon]
MKSKLVSIALCALIFVAIFIVEVPKDVSAQITEEWVARYNSPGNGFEHSSDIVVDSFGNVYVTGSSEYNTSDNDYVTVKYDANGIEQWVARYNGPGNSYDSATKIRVDSLGNIYVTGYSEGNRTDWDYGTIKYDSSGNELWVARYNGPGNGEDGASDMVLDSSGNIYVTGLSEGVGTDNDFATIAYDSLGNELWVARYNSPQNDSDVSGHIDIDEFGNIYVTGFSMGNATFWDYLTIKYDTNGNQLWVARYNGTANHEDRAYDIVVDSSGNIYVTGASEGNGTGFDYTTIKYDTNGNELWVARYNGPGNGDDDGRAMTVDPFGNIYVTGYSEGNGTNYDYTTIKYDSNGNELWVARYNGPENGLDHAYDIALDPFGHVFITGLSWGGWLHENGTLYDYATIAYDSYGNEIWVARYNGPGESDWAYDLTTDSSGYVYVTGSSLGNGTWYDYATIKYSCHFPNQPPIADAGPDQTVNEGDIVEFNGSASYDPDGTIETYEWDFDASDGLWWETGAPPDAFGPDPKYTYDEYGVFIATLIVKDNNGSMDIDTCKITVLVQSPPPPKLYINISQDGEDAILYWDPPANPGIDHYLIYRSTSQIDFDLDNIWVNTSVNNEIDEAGPIPLRSMWNDTNATFPGNETNYEEQYYYIIRAVNTLGYTSRTSRTVGKWTKTFPKGVSTFSLPLESLQPITADYLRNDMKARYIKWMDPVNHIWMKHGDGGDNDTQMEVGKGYEVSFDTSTNYTFAGMPGAMIRYDDDTGFLGFNPDSEAKNLTATVDSLTGNVILNWTQPSSKGVNNQYYVLRSSERDGFWKGNYVQLATLNFDKLSYTDIGNATAGTQYYYMIVPANETGVEGASTYSVGVWTAVCLGQYDTIGIPLKIASNETVDWYCNNIPNMVGINYFIYSQQRWGWHSTRMPEGAYDPQIVMTEGYQISTSNATKFTFIGM